MPRHRVALYSHCAPTTAPTILAAKIKKLNMLIIKLPPYETQFSKARKMEHRFTPGFGGFSTDFGSLESHVVDKS
ncbi:MAG: hypothetical protein R2911_31210 [Caldilineaceae bacterium]